MASIKWIPNIQVLRQKTSLLCQNFTIQCVTAGYTFYWLCYQIFCPNRYTLRKNFPAELVTSPEKILNGKLRFLCSDIQTNWNTNVRRFVLILFRHPLGTRCKLNVKKTPVLVSLLLTLTRFHTYIALIFLLLLWTSKHTVPLTISYHLFRFLIGQYSFVEIRYFINKRNKNDKNTNLFMKTIQNISRKFV